ncbi:dihydrofolate reductase family protein [Trujillonella endophytica]|uniref:Dihydrofolate reductase n=1 Tax=Trujillonella endophytica TaxID=673521 RepID=A0A1H8VRE0_9ACTN|nr:dihydrofolate reductase family protein [Trujillella endophytica]SEP17982.1 Dihydrofolate reductase [Trujillella endophytica]
MGRAILFAAVSLDGYVARDDDSVGPLFDWYGNGEVETTFSDETRVFHVTRQTADFLAGTAPRMAAGVVGRRLFDHTNGWEGVPPNGEHAFVVTHSVPTDWPHLGTAPFTFVTDGVAAAIEQAKAYAGDRDVSVAAGDVGGQALREGLVDRVVLNLVPVVLGSGKPYFGSGGLPEVLLEDPVLVVQGRRVLHLVYDVRR